MMKSFLAYGIDGGGRTDVFHRVGEIALEAIELLDEFLSSLMQLATPDHWAQVQS